MTRIGVVTFPWSIDDQTVVRAVRLSGGTPVLLEHTVADLEGVEAVILPAGGSPSEHDDSGALTASSPIMAEVVRAAEEGLPVLGIGSGFRVLCDAGVLPGRLGRNDSGAFLCRDQRMRVETRDTVWTCALDEGQDIVLVLKSGAGRYEADADTLQRLEDGHQVVLRYLGENPNGSANAIAGITNERGNVVGLMAHPEHGIEALTGPSEDGRLVFRSVLTFVAAAS